MAAKEKINLLEVIPCRSEHITAEREGETIVLSFPRFKYPWMQRFLVPKGMSKELHVKLEEHGTAVWELIDGKRNVREIIEKLADHFQNEEGYESRVSVQIPEASAIMVQPMLKGTELFIGAKYEEKFGHVVLCGLGGIFVEVLKDISSGLAPLSYEEAYSMIHSLRAYKIIKGTRGQKGVNEDKFAEIIVRLSTLLRFATEIKEMDINPLLATEKQVIAVDARIRIEK